MSTPSSERPARRRLLVRGRVQGVGFRYAVATEAHRIGGLRGFVRNLDDGSVEVECEGDPRAVQELAGFLGRGPPLASVKEVVEIEPGGRELPEFRITG